MNGRGVCRGISLPRRRTFVAFLRFSICFLASCRPSSIFCEILTASSCSQTRFTRSSSVSSGGGMRAAAKGSLALRRLETAFMGGGEKQLETGGRRRGDSGCAGHL